eukprot:jgi/Astpho2/5983/Aster-x1340
MAIPAGLLELELAGHASSSSLTADSSQIVARQGALVLLHKEQHVAASAKVSRNSASTAGCLFRLLQQQRVAIQVTAVQCWEVALGAGVLESCSYLVKAQITLLPSFFAEADSPQGVRDPDAIALVTHLKAASRQTRDGGKQLSQAGKSHVGVSQPAAAGPSSSPEWDAASMRRQRLATLRTDVQNIICPNGWSYEVEQPEGLKYPLFKYQKQALAWMSYRELLGTAGPAAPGLIPLQEAAAAAGIGEPGMHPCWEHHLLPSGVEVFGNRLSGHVSRQRPLAPKPQPIGALCDEMGIGKTLEVCALMLRRPCPVSQAPRAEAATPKGLQEGPPGQPGTPQGPGHGHPAAAPSPPCGQQADAGSSEAAEAAQGAPAVAAPSQDPETREPPRMANLVVCPEELIPQWAYEVGDVQVGEKHAELKVVVYEGLRHFRHERHEEEVQDSKAKRGRGKKRKLDASSTAGWGCFTQVINNWEQLQKVADGSVEATFDAEAEAREALAKLQGADVVLTSYTVLQQEVYHSPGLFVERQLRHAKKYKTAESPLLTPRIVFDEAQKVSSGLSGVAAMAGRLWGTHRWAVTGTPMGPRGLQDLQGLLQVLHHDPFSDGRAWSHCVSTPYLSGAPGSREQLEAVLKPIMWRHDGRSAASLGLALPDRNIQVVPLHFNPGERHVYQRIVDQVRDARSAHMSALHSGEDDVTLKPGQRQRAAKKQEKLGSLVANQLQQLRLACTHPQITAFWKELQSELQVEGGVLSLSEIMGRMLDSTQLKLQAAERALCAHLNALAGHLLADVLESETPQARSKRLKQAQHQVSSSGKEHAPPEEGGEQPDQRCGSAIDNWRRLSTAKGKKKQGKQELPEQEVTGAGEAGPSGSGKKRKRAPPASSAQMREEALDLLNKARAIGEEGIGAVAEDVGGDSDIIAASASIRAWRLVQVRTVHLLRQLHELLGNTGEAEVLARLKGRKLADVRETADEAAQRDQARVALAKGEVLRRGAQAARQSNGWDKKAGPSAEGWLEETRATFKRSQEAERGCREQTYLQGTNTTHQVLLGTIVEEAMKQIEQPLVTLRTGLEGVVAVPAMRTVLGRLDAALQTLRGASRPTASMGQEAAFLQHNAWGLLPAKAGLAHSRAEVEQAAAQLRAAGSGDDALRAVRTARNALEKQLQKMQQQAEGLADPRRLAACNPEAALAELLCTRAKIEFARGLKELHKAEVKMELRKHELQEIEDEVQAAAESSEGMPGPDAAIAKKTPAALRSGADRLQEQCLQLRSEKRFQQNQMGLLPPQLKLRLAALRDLSLPWLLMEAVLLLLAAVPRPKASSREEAQLGQATAASLQQSGPASLHQNGPAQIDLTGGEAPLQEDTESQRPDTGTCGICLSPLGDILQMFKCGHFFCDNCVTTLVQGGGPLFCPTCRRKISKSSIKRVANGQSLCLDEPEYIRVPVVGQWMTKITSLLRRLIKLRESAPDEKSLVFSQFPDALELVARALRINGFDAAQLSTRQKSKAVLTKFEKNDGCKVFLLSLRKGAAGLTLIRANHVFLLEPAMDPAILQQAVGRAHRMGQTKIVHVYRVLMSGTIEEAVMQHQEGRQALADQHLACDEANGGDAAQDVTGQQAPAKERLDAEAVENLLQAIL